MGLLKCPDCKKLISDIFPMHDCVDKKKKKASAKPVQLKGKRFGWCKDGWLHPHDDIQSLDDGLNYEIALYNDKMGKGDIRVRVIIEQIDPP